MIIDNTYFQKGILYIANNRDVSASNAPSVVSELDTFIDIYERQLLLNALGTVLYKELKTAMTDLPNAAQKWQDLVNGVDYVIDGKTYRWEGLKGYNKNSLIAFYVFCEYLRNDESVYTTVGVVKNKANNADNFDLSPKYIKAWNTFLRMYQSNTNDPMIVVNAFGHVGLDYYGGKNVQVSLYQYLIDQNTLDDTNFPDVEFTFYRSENTFGT